MDIKPYDEVFKMIKSSEFNQLDNVSLIFFLMMSSENYLEQNLAYDEILNLENYIIQYRNVALTIQWISTYSKHNCSIKNIIASTDDPGELIQLFIHDKSCYKLIYQKILELNDEPQINFMVWMCHAEPFISEMLQYIVNYYPQHIATIYNHLNNRRLELKYSPDHEIALLYSPPGREIIVSSNMDKDIIEECKNYANKKITDLEQLFETYVPYEYKHYALGAII